MEQKLIGIMKQEEPILVAIHCLVYNHEPYLRDCLEGFVMQQTNFPFVAIVHDDASTDASAAIIREYEEKYPDIIKPIYEAENQYSKPDGSLGRIMNEAIAATGAKYVAMCEGDDYWTDPLKLQKQVDFLEEHSDYSMCFHRCKTLMVDTGEMRNEFLVRDLPYESSIYQLAQGNYIHTLSVVYRKYNDIFSKRNALGPCMPGDYVLWMLLAEHGKIWKFEEFMGVYRYGCGIWTAEHNYIKQQMKTLETFSKLYVVLSDAKAKDILYRQILNIEQVVSTEFGHIIRDYRIIKNSKAYRLGKFLLSPFAWLRRKLK